MRPSPRRDRRHTLLLPVLILHAATLYSSAAQLEPRDFAVELQAEVSAEPPQIILRWRGNESAREYTLNRKGRQELQWTKVATLDGHETWFVDKDVAPGVGYEYQVVKRGSPGYIGYGYIYAGIKLPLVDDRGRIIVLAETSIASELEIELDRLESDLVGDGWRVARRTVPREAKPPEVKEVIRRAYLEDQANTRALLLFGNIPVAYSGDLAPDGHANHQGAWPTDLYYADLDGDWTDTTVISTNAELVRTQNVPGDGKFDQSEPPTSLELEVGRVDLSRMTCFINKSPSRNEVDLLRQYLEKNHRFRHGQIPMDARALIYDRMGLGAPEPLAATAWRNFSPFVGRNIEVAAWGEVIPATASKTYLWTSVVAGGGFVYADGVGPSDVFALNTVNAVFMMFCGSYYGDWDNESNFLRSPLGASGSTLVSVYSANLHWSFHTMALGETMGRAARITQENGTNGLYLPHNRAAGKVHVTLHGDPTLRVHPIAPPRNVRGVELAGSLTLSWDPVSVPGLEGYFVYRAEIPGGPYVRITPAPLSLPLLVVQGGAGKHFIVKTAAITTSPSGSYWNTSQGAYFPVPDFSLGSGAPSAPRNLAVVKVEREALTLGWLTASVNHTGFELERLIPGETNFVKVASISAETSTFRDAALPVSGTYGYRVRAVNSTGASDYSNPVFASTTAASAEFLGEDRITRGSWTGVYGSAGYAIPGLEGNLPAGSTLIVSNAISYEPWYVTNETRAVQMPDSTDRLLNCWVNELPFALHLRTPGDAIRQIAIYCMDFHRHGTSFEIAIHDVVTGQLLDQRRVENPNEGVYSLYHIRGQVYIKIIPPGESVNVEIYGLFMDAPTVHPVRISPPGGAFAGKTLVRLDSITPNTDIRYTLDGSVPGLASPKYTEPFWLYATAEVRAAAFKEGLPPPEVAIAQFQNSLVNRIGFIRWEEQLKGNWVSQLGSEGYWIPEGAKALPPYAEVSLQPGASWLWGDSVSEDRALFRDVKAQQRVAAAWYSTNILELDLAVYDTRRRAIALYFLDWDNGGRAQEVELLDGTGAVRDRFTVEKFVNGKYLVFGLKGYTKIRIRRISGQNAVLNGIFFDPVPPAINAGTPVSLSNPSIFNGRLKLTALGVEDERFCLDASTDLKTWSCVQTNSFPTQTMEFEIALDPGPSHFHRAHFVP